jgi:gliding motility-associated-like protein
MVSLRKISPIAIILFLIVIIFAKNETYAQSTYGDTVCSIDITADNLEICEGDCVNLSATGDCPNNLMLNDFEDGTLGSGWAANCSPMFNNPCGVPPFASNIYAWIGDASDFPRDLITETFDVTDECEICFDLRFAIQAAGSPCEGPDEMDEGVELQYSSDGGSTWYSITYFCPNGNLYASNSWVGQSTAGGSGTTNFTSWNNYCFDVPAGATGSNTRFRWHQEQVTSNVFDHWGLDNVLITCPSPDEQVAWYEGTSTTPFDLTYNPPTLCPSTTTTYTVEIEDPTVGPATADSDQVTITVYNPPTLSISGLDSYYCEDDPPVTLTGNPSGGSFSGTGVSGNEFDPGAAGAGGPYTITYSWDQMDSGGTTVLCSFSTNTTVSVDPQPNADAGSDDEICGTDYTLSATSSVGTGTWTVSPGTGLTIDDVNDPNSDVTATSYGSYTLTWTEVSGNCSDDDAVVLDFYPVPDPDIQGVSSACDFNTPVTLDAGAGFDDYAWNISEFTQTIEVSTNGTYVVTVTNNSICSATDSFSFTVYPGPSVDIGPEQIICDYNAPITLDAGPGLDEYLWNTGDVTQTIDADTTGTYIVTVTNSDGCTSSDAMLLTVNPSPTPDIGGDQNICDYDTASVTLDAGPGDIYQWNISENTRTITVNETGAYAVTVTNYFGCTGADSMNLVIDELPDPDLGPDTVLCNYDAPVLLDPGTDPSFAYQWSDNSNGSVLQVGETGIYSVTVSEGICSAEDEIEVMVNPVPTVDLGDDQGVCEVDGPFVLDAGPGMAMYHWNTGNYSQTQNVMETDTYVVTVSNQYGCTASDSMLFHIDTMPLSGIYHDTHYCIDHEPFYLEAASEGGTWDGTGIADPNTGYFAPQIVGDNTTHIVYTVTNGECTSVSETDVHVHALPDIHVINVKNLSCYEDETGGIQVAAPSSTSPVFNWVNHDMSGAHIQNLEAGIYDLEVVDVYSCRSDTTLIVSQPSELLVDYESGHPSCIGYNDGYIDFMVTGGVEPYIYCWDMGESHSPSFARLYEREYNFVIKDNNGCKENVSVKLVDTPIECIRIPNAFTPNGDGTNDTWIIENLEIYNNYQIQVFNRWGQLMYYSETGDEPWDGTTMNGKKVPAGSYLYVIKLDSGREQKTGTISVIY